jgi:hypothetical protein
MVASGILKVSFKKYGPQLNIYIIIQSTGNAGSI